MPNVNEFALWPAGIPEDLPREFGIAVPDAVFVNHPPASLMAVIQKTCDLVAARGYDVISHRDESRMELVITFRRRKTPCQQ